MDRSRTIRIAPSEVELLFKLLQVVLSGLGEPKRRESSEKANSEILSLSVLTLSANVAECTTPASQVDHSTLRTTETET